MAAEYRNIIAIIRVDRLEHVEKALQALHVSGVSVSRVKGYGEYADFFARDWMSTYARIEIFTRAEHADGIVSAVAAAASTGTPGDGIVAVEPVVLLLRIRSGSRVPAG